MKKILSFVFSALLLLAAGGAIAAGAHGHHGFGGPMGHGDPQAMAAHMAMMAKTLGLTEDQKTAAKQIHEETQAQAEPLQEQVHQQWEEIDQMLDAGNANATEIGNRVIAAHAAKQQLKALHEGAMSRFQSLLTAEQRTKLEELKSRHEGRGDHERR